MSGGSIGKFGPVTINNGAAITASNNIEYDGNIINNGTINAGSGISTFGGTTTLSGSSVSSFNGVTINSSSTLTSPLSGSMNIAGNFVNNGTFTHNNGTVVFNGTSTISGTSTTSLFGVTITGTLTAPLSSVLNIAVNLSNSGPFNHSSGTITLNGTVSAQSLVGTINFNNVNVSNPSQVNNNGTTNLNGAL